MDVQTRDDATRTALVLGASGGLGSEVARALSDNGWYVKALTRRPQSSQPDDVEWIVGDAMNAFDVRHAAADVHIIVHAVNPSAYKDWSSTVLRMMDNTILAAEQAGCARVILPGCLLNYSRNAFPLIAETSFQNPPDTKGLIRVEMEKRLEAAVTEGRIKALILRCGDFFGPASGNSWFTQAVIESGKPLTQIKYPGPLDVRHSWAYLPDVADTIAMLVDLEYKLQRFAVFHFPGHLVSGRELCGMIKEVTQRPEVPIRPFPWFIYWMKSPFIQTCREMRKLRYLWEGEAALDGRKLLAFLDPQAIPSTPLADAIRATVTAHGLCGDKAP